MIVASLALTLGMQRDGEHKVSLQMVATIAGGQHPPEERGQARDPLILQMLDAGAQRLLIECHSLQRKEAAGGRTAVTAKGDPGGKGTPGAALLLQVGDRLQTGRAKKAPAASAAGAVWREKQIEQALSPIKKGPSFSQGTSLLSTKVPTGRVRPGCCLPSLSRERRALAT